MQMLSAREKSLMRGEIISRLVDTCTLINPPVTASVTASGGVSRTPTETGGVICRLGPSTLRPSEKAIADKLSLINPAVVTFKHDQTNVTAQTQIRFGSGASAELYEVRGFMPRQNTRLSLRVICERVR